MAKRVGKSRSAIANLLRLLLPEGVRSLWWEESWRGTRVACFRSRMRRRSMRAQNDSGKRPFRTRGGGAHEGLALNACGKGEKPAKAKKVPVEIREAQDTLSKALSTRCRLKGRLPKEKYRLIIILRSSWKKFTKYSGRRNEKPAGTEGSLYCAASLTTKKTLSK